MGGFYDYYYNSFFNVKTHHAQVALLRCEEQVGLQTKKKISKTKRSLFQPATFCYTDKSVNIRYTCVIYKSRAMMPYLKEL